MGLGILGGVIPALGPVIAGGTLASLLANAAGGAAVGAVAGSLLDAGIPQHEAKYYHGELEKGRFLVTVKPEGRAQDATIILCRNDAYDLQSAGTTVDGDRKPRGGRCPPGACRRGTRSR